MLLYSTYLTGQAQTIGPADFGWPKTVFASRNYKKKFSNQKRKVFRKVMEIKGLGGGVLELRRRCKFAENAAHQNKAKKGHLEMEIYSSICRTSVPSGILKLNSESSRLPPNAELIRSMRVSSP